MNEHIEKNLNFLKQWIEDVKLSIKKENYVEACGQIDNCSELVEIMSNECINQPSNN